jgi:hypothetical protein
MNKYVLAALLLIAVLALGVFGNHYLHLKADWLTPIDFYGKVVDEGTNPVPDAEANLVWTDLSVKGNSEWKTKSDRNGRFALRRARGKNLIVRVSKEGYYAYEPSGLAFDYAGDAQNFVADKSKPVMFRLRKKGEAEPVAYCKKSFLIKKNGEPVELSLIVGKRVTAGQGDVRVECWTEKPKDTWKYNWRCRIAVANGGLQQYTNEFPFLAPVDGYTPTDEIKMPVSLGEAWSPSAKRNYFLRLANGSYARMTFAMIAGGDHFFEIESILNPSGSRNLEFDPNKVIQAPN